ncbi:MAG: hypothetical protein H7A42_01950 [Chlamydiales bacterium]|nr:hypothetical protein [Chlamydiales bacterium]
MSSFSWICYRNSFSTRPFAYGSERAHAPSIRIEDELIPLYYNGGCYFAEAKTHPVKILGTYADFDDEAAIISCQSGKESPFSVEFISRCALRALLRENTPAEVRETLAHSENKRKKFYCNSSARTKYITLIYY